MNWYKTAYRITDEKRGIFTDIQNLLQDENITDDEKEHLLMLKENLMQKEIPAEQIMSDLGDLSERIYERTQQQIESITPQLYEPTPSDKKPITGREFFNKLRAILRQGSLTRYRNFISAVNTKALAQTIETERIGDWFIKNNMTDFITYTLKTVPLSPNEEKKLLDYLVKVSPSIKDPDKLGDIINFLIEKGADKSVILQISQSFQDPSQLKKVLFNSEESIDYFFNEDPELVKRFFYNSAKNKSGFNKRTNSAAIRVSASKILDDEFAAFMIDNMKSKSKMKSKRGTYTGYLACLPAMAAYGGLGDENKLKLETIYKDLKKKGYTDLVRGMDCATLKNPTTPEKNIDEVISEYCPNSKLGLSQYKIERMRPQQKIKLMYQLGLQFIGFHGTSAFIYKEIKKKGKMLSGALTQTKLSTLGDDVLYSNQIFLSPIYAVAKIYRDQKSRMTDPMMLTLRFPTYNLYEAKFIAGVITLQEAQKQLRYINESKNILTSLAQENPQTVKEFTKLLLFLNSSVESTVLGELSAGYITNATSESGRAQKAASTMKKTAEDEDNEFYDLIMKALKNEEEHYLAGAIMTKIDELGLLDDFFTDKFDSLLFLSGSIYTSEREKGNQRYNTLVTLLDDLLYKASTMGVNMKSYSDQEIKDLGTEWLSQEAEEETYTGDELIELYREEYGDDDDDDERKLFS